MSEETSQTPPITRQPRRQRRAAPTGAGMFTADNLQSILQGSDIQAGSTGSSGSPVIPNIPGAGGDISNIESQQAAGATPPVRQRRRRVRPEGSGEHGSADAQGESASLFSITSSKSGDSEIEKSKDPLGASLASVRRARSRIPTATDFAPEDRDEIASKSSRNIPMKSSDTAAETADIDKEPSKSVEDQVSDIVEKSDAQAGEDSAVPAPEISRPPRRRRGDRASGRNISALSFEKGEPSVAELTGIGTPESTEHENLNVEKEPLPDQSPISNIKVPDETDQVGKDFVAVAQVDVIEAVENVPVANIEGTAATSPATSLQPDLRRESLGVLPLGIPNTDESQLSSLQRSKSVPPSMATTLLHEEVEAVKGEQLVLEKQLLSKKLEKLSLDHRNLQSELAEKSAEISSLVAAKLLLETEKDMILNKPKEDLKPVDNEEVIELRKEVAQWKSLAEDAANILEIWQDAYKDILPSEAYLLKIMEESGQTITEEKLSELAEEYSNLELDPSFFVLHRREVLLKSHLSHIWGKSVDLLADHASSIPVIEDPNQMVDLDGVEISRDALLLLQELESVKLRNSSLCKILKSDDILNDGMMPF